MASQNSTTEWKGKVTAELKSLPADKVWLFVADSFCNLQNYFPSIETCYPVEGETGKPGLVRYCASAPHPSSSDDGTTTTTVVKWAKEKLVMIDPAERCLSYEIVDNNMGFKSYKAVFQVSPVVNGCGGDGGGSKIEWCFEADPVEGIMRLEDFESYADCYLQFMAKKIESNCLSTDQI